MDSKQYKIEDGHQTRFAMTKQAAIKLARVLSSTGSVIVCKRNANGDGYDMIGRYRFGRAA